MDIALFPGCSFNGLAREYGDTVRLVMQKLGIKLRELDDWNCCGASAAHSLDHGLAKNLARRNLEIAGEMRLGAIVSPCPNCTLRLKTAAAEEHNDKFVISHLLQLLSAPEMSEKISALAEKKLGLRIAAYYGCYLTRPGKIAAFDDPEQPRSMDRLLGLLGAETVNWSHKTECCGGSHGASDTGVVLDLGGQVVEAASQAGAEAIAIACPMCQINLDTRQPEMGLGKTLPVLYFTQLMGLAFGIAPRALGFNRHITDPRPLLRSKGLI